MVEQGRDGHISKEKVGAYLCQEKEEDSRLSLFDDNAEGGSCLLAILDDDVQQEVAAWNPEATEQIAHKMSLGFIQGLIQQKIDGHWKGNGLGSVIWRKNKEGTVIFPLLDFETQKQVAFWDLEETNKSAHLASLDFIKWLIAQAKQGKWKKERVGIIVWRWPTGTMLQLRRSLALSALSLPNGWSSRPGRVCGTRVQLAALSVGKTSREVSS